MSNTNNEMQAEVKANEFSGQSANLPVPKYVNPAGDEYPVLACNCFLFPDGLSTTKEEIEDQLQTIKSCGFNATTWISRGLSQPWWSQITTYYNVAASLGLRSIYMLQNNVPVVISQSGSTTYQPTLETIAEILNLNKGTENLWGYKLADEPGFNEWGYTTQTAPVGTKDLPAMNRTYLQNANGHVGFITLAALVKESIVGTEIFNSDSSNKIKYERYLHAISNKLNPALLTVDIYPVLEYTDDSKGFVSLQNVLILDRYYYILEAIGNFSRQSNVPVWMYMLSVQFKTYHAGSTIVHSEFPIPTEGILRYQALTAIAFGCQGLVFWTYALQPNNMQTDSSTGEKIPSEEFLLAPYNNDGTRSEIWYNCAAVIPGIKLFGKMLLGAKFIEAAHVYGPAYVRNPYPETQQLPASGIGCVLKATATGPGIVITRLEKGSEKYVAIVNHSPEDYEDFTLTVSPGCRWTEYRMMDWSDNYLTETEHQRESQEKTVSRMLQPGSMMLIKFEWA